MLAISGKQVLSPRNVIHTTEERTEFQIGTISSGYFTAHGNPRIKSLQSRDQPCPGRSPSWLLTPWPPSHTSSGTHCHWNLFALLMRIKSAVTANFFCSLCSVYVSLKHLPCLLISWVQRNKRYIGNMAHVLNFFPWFWKR